MRLFTERTWRDVALSRARTHSHTRLLSMSGLSLAFAGAGALLWSRAPADQHLALAAWILLWLFVAGSWAAMLAMKRAVGTATS